MFLFKFLAMATLGPEPVGIYGFLKVEFVILPDDSPYSNHVTMFVPPLASAYPFKVASFSEIKEAGLVVTIGAPAKTG